MKKYGKIPLLLAGALFILAGMLYLKQVSDGSGEFTAPEQGREYNWTIRGTEQASGGQIPELNGSEAGKEGNETQPGTAGAETPPGDREGASEAADGRININTAGVEELVSLPMIGEKRAEAIIRYRKENGPFQSPEEITAVTGIGNGIYKRIKDKIRV